MQAPGEQLAESAKAGMLCLLNDLDAINFFPIEGYSSWDGCNFSGAMAELQLLRTLSLVSRDLDAATRSVLNELSQAALAQNYHPAFQACIAVFCPDVMEGAKHFFAAKSVAAAMCCYHLSELKINVEEFRQFDNEWLLHELNKCPRLRALSISDRGFIPAEAHLLGFLLSQVKSVRHLQ